MKILIALILGIILAIILTSLTDKQKEVNESKL